MMSPKEYVNLAESEIDVSWNNTYSLRRQERALTLAQVYATLALVAAHRPWGA